MCDEDGRYRLADTVVRDEHELVGRRASNA
jgi:hypothetical protein